MAVSTGNTVVKFVIDFLELSKSSKSSKPLELSKACHRFLHPLMIHCKNVAADGGVRASFRDQENMIDLRDFHSYILLLLLMLYNYNFSFHPRLCNISKSLQIPNLPTNLLSLESATLLQLPDLLPLLLIQPPPSPT